MLSFRAFSREMMAGFVDAREKDGALHDDPDTVFGTFIDSMHRQGHPMDWTLHLDLAKALANPGDEATLRWAAVGAARRWTRMENSGVRWIAVAVPGASQFMAIGERSRSTALGPRVLSAQAAGLSESSAFCFQTGIGDVRLSDGSWLRHYARASRATTLKQKAER